MIGNKEWLFDFDDSFRESVKLGDDSKMHVMGKGKLKMYIGGITQVISEVYYLPGLKNNLLSIGQLQQKNLTIVFKNDICKVFHEERGLIMSTPMSANRMFVIKATVLVPMCLQTTNEIDSQLWHKRYGHLSYKGLNTLVKKEMVRGLPALKEASDVCSDCLFGKQHREVIPKKDKASAFESFKRFKAVAEKESGCQILSLRTDRGGEFMSEAFNKYCTEQGIKRQLTTAYTPQQNGVSERKNRTIMNMVRCMLNDKKVPKKFWPESVKWAVYVLNRSPTLSVKDVTPEEAWSSMKPSVKHFKIFGCLAFVHVPDAQRKKLDNKSTKCIHLGVSEESKAYKLYNPIDRKIIISRDVVFDESKGWNWGEASETQQKTLYDNDDEPAEIAEEADTDVNDDVNNEQDPQNLTVPDSESDEQYESEDELPPRVIKRPGYLSDYVTGQKLEEEEQLHNLGVFCNNTDPTTFDEAVKHEVWRKAMDQEIECIESNDTWELTELPSGSKKIGVKWIYKTKLNEKGKVEKYKARLVAKGYSQQYGIDFKEVFAPMARWDTIRTVLSIAASESWIVYQLDVKSAFLHGELSEDVQAPRAWYSKIEAYFSNEKFEKCSHEHTLFVKQVEEKILIVSLYVDDLIYTGNDDELIRDFKSSMKRNFAMTDLGKMSYFLGVEVTQNDRGIFINQQKYAAEILNRFNMDSCNFVCSPIVPGTKLFKDENGKCVDSTQFKQMVGCLMYLIATRPDLCYSVCLIARYMERPTEIHLAAAKRILRYLKGTISYGVLYDKGSLNMKLEGWTDSDYAGDSDDRKSTSGYVFKLGSGAISWSSKKQPIVTLSTTEAEYVAAASGACQGVWMRRILQQLGQKQDKPSTMYCDNSSSIKLSKNPILHGRCKHIDVRYHFLRDLTKQGVVELIHCSTDEQIADIMTKPLKLESFVKLRSKLGVCDAFNSNN
ncbi:unnamed protein product [Trifolium pratense]|uniref:Uncharacterized protein n=1 Tax=Trifolium pratense TaxID=57577 RepID=A0ACB0JU62_TRIPR|nr:unnamed protein product [Trifolium pratense]